MRKSLHDILVMSARDIMFIMANNHRVIPNSVYDPSYPGRHNGFTDYERVIRFYSYHMDGVTDKEFEKILKKDIIPILRKQRCQRCKIISSKLEGYFD